MMEENQSFLKIQHKQNKVGKGKGKHNNTKGWFSLATES